MKRTVAIHNLGCKVNEYEAQVMADNLKDAGFELVDFKEAADIYIINTCSVTNIADRKSRQMLHRAKKKNPDAIVIAAGCYVQSAGEELLKDNSVDIIIGNNNKGKLISIINDYFESFENFNTIRKCEYIIDINKDSEYEEMLLRDTGIKTRAYMKIQDGCNQFCSYCIIPYVRGRIRSRKIENILNEAVKLSESGYKEIVLTGIHVSSYGKDLEEDISLIDVIEKINEIPGIERIRLSSLEPRIITEEFLGRLKKIDKFCPHFHLSLQSGCDETLKRMNRKYTCKEYKNGVELIRKYFDKPNVSTDVIVGFPGETKEEFEKTYEYLKELKLSKMHIFKYSRRKGTVADRMDNQVDDKLKEERSDLLLELENQYEHAFSESFIGEEKEVLFEEAISINDMNFLCGYTKEYVKVFIKTDKDYKNKIIRVKILGKISEKYSGINGTLGENILAIDM